MVEFGEQLRRAREEKGMTQQTLAEELYVTRQSVSHWECGDRFPDLLTTKKISEILDVSLDDLLSGKDMNKVVERNQVVENKFANNMMILLYAVAIFSILFNLIDRIITTDWTYITKWAVKCNDVYTAVNVYAEIICGVIGIAVFAYGLVHALKGTLSPKRIGVVIAVYFASNIVEFVNMMVQLRDPRLIGGNVALECIKFFPLIFGVIAAVMYYIRRDNKVIWPVMVIVVAAFELLKSFIWTVSCVFYDIKYLSEDNNQIHDALSTGDKSMIVTAILRGLPAVLAYGLMIYQTVILYNKRKNAAEITEEVTI